MSKEQWGYFRNLIQGDSRTSALLAFLVPAGAIQDSIYLRTSPPPTLNQASYQAITSHKEGTNGLIMCQNPDTLTEAVQHVGHSAELILNPYLTDTQWETVKTNIEELGGFTKSIKNNYRNHIDLEQGLQELWLTLMPATRLVYLNEKFLDGAIVMPLYSTPVYDWRGKKDFFAKSLESQVKDFLLKESVDYAWWRIDSFLELSGEDVTPEDTKGFLLPTFQNSKLYGGHPAALKNTPADTQLVVGEWFFEETRKTVIEFTDTDGKENWLFSEEPFLCVDLPTSARRIRSTAAVLHGVLEKIFAVISPDDLVAWDNLMGLLDANVKLDEALELVRAL